MDKAYKIIVDLICNQHNLYGLPTTKHTDNQTIHTWRLYQSIRDVRHFHLSISFCKDLCIIKSIPKAQGQDLHGNEIKDYIGNPMDVEEIRLQEPDAIHKIQEAAKNIITPNFPQRKP